MLEIDSVVKVVSPPENYQHLLNTYGFVSFIPEGRQTLEVAILNEDGLDNIYLLPENSLCIDTSEEALGSYANYQNSLNEIAKEAEERKTKKAAVANFLARRHNISPDEVYGVYSAMLSYEEFYEDFIKKPFQ